MLTMFAVWILTSYSLFILLIELSEAGRAFLTLVCRSSVRFSCCRLNDSAWGLSISLALDGNAKLFVCAKSLIDEIQPSTKLVAFILS
jgi:hypothetical protein